MQRPPLLGLVLLAMTPTAGPARGDASPPARELYKQAIPGTDASVEMVPIPGGWFVMGSARGGKGDETPRVEVEVEPFYIGKFEVTSAEYEPFLKNYHRLAEADYARRHKVPADRFADAVTYPTPFYEIEGGPALDRMGRGGRLPAVGMSQFDARQYTKWLSKKTGRFYRLPTEAEWEYACRAGTAAAYSFGDDPKQLDDYGWYVDNSELNDSRPGYREVGEKKPNPWGLYDMHGNVAEWCIDQYDPQWYRRFEGRGRVKASGVINWPTKKFPRVIRGGSYQHEAADCRSAARYGSSHKEEDPYNIYDMPESPHWSSRGFWIGFRVVSPVKEPTEAEKLRYWNADDRLTQEGLKSSREVHELVEPAAGK